MKIPAVTAIASLLLFTGVLGASTRQARSPALTCGKPFPGYVDAMEEILRAYLARTGPEAVQTRRTFHLSLDASIVPVFVRDSTVCYGIRKAIDSLSGEWSRPYSTIAQPDSTRALYIFAVDTILVAGDLERGIHGATHIFTRRFVRLARLY